MAERETPITHQLSRRWFAAGAVAVVAAPAASGQQKASQTKPAESAEAKTATASQPPPRSRALLEFDLPIATEPAMIFRA